MNTVKERKMKGIQQTLYAALALLVLGGYGLCFAQESSTSPTPESATAVPQKKSHVPTKELFHENWDSPILEGSHFTPQVPILGERDDVKERNFIREKFMLQWRPYDPLDLFVVMPRGVTKPPVILYLYSYPSGIDRFSDTKWCETVTEGGYAAVGFVSALTEPRIGHHAIKEWFVSELQETLSTSAHDIPMILDYLASRGDLDMDHVGMFGQGSGGSIAILASAAETRLKAIDVLAPWGDWPNWLAKSAVIPPAYRPDYLTPEFLAQVSTLDPIGWLPMANARSIRIQDVRQNQQMPAESQEKIEAAAPKIAEIDQYGDYAAFLQHDAGGKAFDWLKRQLKPGAVPDTLAANSETKRVHVYPAVNKPARSLPMPE
jgi:hypothetical protein